MDFQLVFETARPVEEAIKAVTATLADRKFSVLWHLHINQKLSEKGLTVAPDVHILEVCSATKAKQAIDTNPAVAAFLPCKIVVRSENGATQMILVRPTKLLGLVGDPNLMGLAEDVEAIMAASIREACEG